ncbi:MAG: metallophosphoesterase [Lachnospiraceae bacterium]|nr:metallophosphoesterase [Lachnospiraceae bacterium]
MSYYSRLNKSFEGALRLPLNPLSKYVLISDCHRGTGSSNDNFLRNQNLYFAALQCYYRSGYTYIELGDGDELWENLKMEQIIKTHSEVFCLLSNFYKRGRLYMLYGNHDMAKKDAHFTAKNLSNWPSCENDPTLTKQPLLPDIKFYEGIILENTSAPEAMDVYLTHGHQTDLFNSDWWKVSRFLVRYLWKPLERYGVLDPTSAAKNYTRQNRTEQRLSNWAKQEKHILITGHTHRPKLLESEPYYYNSGCCIHPSCITCLEIERMHIRLVKWKLATRQDMSLYVSKEVLAGPIPLWQNVAKY